MRTRPVLTVALVPLLVAVALAGCARPGDDLPGTGEAGDDEMSVLARDLDTVWEVAHAPDGRTFLTERPGRVRVVEADGELRSDPWASPPAAETGEAGLMGLALHPGFPDPPYIYLMFTARAGGAGDGDLVNRIVRYREQDGRGARPEVLVDGIPGASRHDGGRLAFGPDGMLYATTGDATDAGRAQDRDDLAGKVLRMTPDGAVPDDNPFAGSHVWTWGHRNPQGLDFRPGTGRPYVSEHGPDNHDEVNRLQAGANYGWPEVRGSDDGGGRFEPAVWSSGSGGTVAPGGAAFVDAPGSPLHGAFVFVTLKAEQVHVLELSGDGRAVVQEAVVLDGHFGRLRAATWGPDDALYLSTSNLDGRGLPSGGDDRVVRVPLSVLEERVGWA